MITAKEIRAFMAFRNWRQRELAQAVNVSQGTVSRWLGGAIPEPLHQEALALLMAGEASPSFVLSRATAPAQFLGEKNLPVYAAAEGGPGELVVYTDPIEYVPRPWYLGEVKDGYAVLVVGESMVPAFRPGELAIVNPRLPPMRGKDHILVQENESGEFRAAIKHVLSWTAAEWRLEQYNPPLPSQREFSLSRDIWRKAFRVVGKYEGG